MADPHADTHAHDYQHGSMPVTEQAATYSLFMNLAKWGSLIVAVVLLFLVLWFQPGGSFLMGLIAAAVLAVAGTWFLRKPKTDH